jgi:hypothetical protein
MAEGTKQMVRFWTGGLMAPAPRKKKKSSYFPAQKCAPVSLSILEATGCIFCTNALGRRCVCATAAS